MIVTQEIATNLIAMGMLFGAGLAFGGCIVFWAFASIAEFVTYTFRDKKNGL